MSEMKKCLFCNESASYNEQGALNLIYKVVCTNCGSYVVSDRIADQDCNTVKAYSLYKHLISGLIREKNELALQLETITSKNILYLLNDSLIPKTIIQKFDKVLLYYYRKTEQYGGWQSVDEKTPYAIGYAANIEELLNIANTLVQSGYFTKIASGGNMLQFSVSLKGLSKAEELLSINIGSTKVFVAMGFYPDLIAVLEGAIKPASKECGFEAFIVSEKEHNGDITDRIISDIKTSRFIIADLTYNNQGAYFEAGFAQGRGIEVIRTCKKEWFDGHDEKGEKNHLHFDINHYNFILWENNDDLKEKLKNRIKATIL